MEVMSFVLRHLEVNFEAKWILTCTLSFENEISLNYLAFNFSVNLGVFQKKKKKKVF